MENILTDGIKRRLSYYNGGKIENLTKTKQVYYAIVNDGQSEPYVYESCPANGRRAWYFDSIAKIKSSITHSCTKHPDYTNELLESGVIEIKSMNIIFK